MKRIGMYTGKVYNDSIDVSIIKECCQCCQEETTQEEINRARIQCLACAGNVNCLKGIEKRGLFL